MCGVLFSNRSRARSLSLSLWSLFNVNYALSFKHTHSYASNIHCIIFIILNIVSNECMCSKELCGRNYKLWKLILWKQTEVFCYFVCLKNFSHIKWAKGEHLRVIWFDQSSFYRFYNWNEAESHCQKWTVWGILHRFSIFHHKSENLCYS